jgi:tetratricopeptide (TPR) repeat protein
MYIKKLLLAISLLLTVNIVLAQSSVKNPSDPAYLSGRQKYDTKNYQAAWHDFNLLVQKQLNETQSFLEKKKKFESLSEYERALADNAELIVRRADLSLPYYYRGMCNLKAQDVDKAKQDFLKAVEIDNKLGDAYLELGKLELGSGKGKDNACILLRNAADNGNEEAKDLYATQFCLNSSLNYMKEGTIKMNLNQYEAAITDFNLAIKLNPDSASFYYKRGMCYYGLSKFDKAVADFSKAIELQPLAEYYFKRGQAYYSQQWHKPAFEDYTKALEFDKTNSDFYLYRAYACEGMGNPKSAVFDYSEVIRLKPEDATAYLKRALLKQEMKDKSCCKDFKKAADLGNEEASEYYKTCK